MGGEDMGCIIKSTLQLEKFNRECCLLKQSFKLAGILLLPKEPIPFNMPKINPADIPTITPTSREDWHHWLEQNHTTAPAVWVVYYKKLAKMPTVVYSDAVDEALCFGWIDSKAQTIDAERYRQYFCPRKPKSVWSKVNKAKIERLIAENRMQPAGYACIAAAKANGTWTTLDEAEELFVPPYLANAFALNPAAENRYLKLSRSDQRNLLQWLVLTGSEATREKKIAEIVDYLARGEKPPQIAAQKKNKE